MDALTPGSRSMSASSLGSAYSHALKRTSTAADGGNTKKTATGSSVLPPFPRQGLTLAAIEQLLADHPEISPTMTTSTVCHTIVKPLTVPDDCDVLVSQTANGWFKHTYRNRATGSESQEPPGATLSFAELVLAKNKAGAELVGDANVSSAIPGRVHSAMW
jgi:hypothetical protein